MLTPEIVEEFAEFLRNNYLYVVSSISLDPDFSDEETVRWNLDNGLVFSRMFETEVRFYIYIHDVAHIGMSRYSKETEEFEVINSISIVDNTVAIEYFLKLWKAGHWVNFS